MRINIGAGSVPLPGYVPVDRKTGGEAFPLTLPGGEIVPDNSCDEIRASHVLEHFLSAQIQDIVSHWAAKLKPGGVLKIAVPDFEWCARAYLEGKQAPIEGYVMGGQVDADDRHGAIFDAETLVDLFRGAGLTDIGRWDADAEDCSALPVSLNMRAVKPVQIEKGSFKVSAVMSVPRLGFMDNFTCALSALAPLGITVTPFFGAFWGQCLERGFETLIERDAPDAILSIDYDTVFTAQNVATLMRLMVLHPEADAICALQSARGWGSPLFSFDLPEGMAHTAIPKTFFDSDLTKLRTGHFGLTLIRTSALKDMPRPWLWSKPAADGTWGEGRTDDDIYFWRQWAAAGKTLFNANRVVVGHIESMIRWPGRDLGTIHQRAAEFSTQGAPRDIWK
jgi:predicted SAM-dependent methyltransferase